MSDFYSASLCLQIAPACGISDQREIYLQKYCPPAHKIQSSPYLFPKTYLV